MAKEARLLEPPIGSFPSSSEFALTQTKQPGSTEPGCDSKAIPAGISYYKTFVTPGVGIGYVRSAFGRIGGVSLKLWKVSTGEIDPDASASAHEISRPE